MRFRHALIRRLAAVACLGAPLLAMTAYSADAEFTAGLPPGLRPTLVNVARTTDRSLYGPQIAVNPRDPNNIVVAAIADTGYTQACQASGDPNCEVVQTSFGFLTPAGYFNPTLGFLVRGVFVSFDRGRTFKEIDLFNFAPVGRPELDTQNEGGLSVGPDGTFYLQMNTLDWGSPMNFAPAAGVALSKSIDGGLTWSQPTLIGTPGDFPYLTVDQSTGTIYSLSGDSPLCLRQSCVDPNSPILTTFSDAFVAASRDGVHWTQPRRAGGTDGANQFDGSSGKDIAAAHGAVATTFISTSAPGCAFFVGGAAPCTVFQTSTNAGATWSRHRVPVGSVGVNTLVAADPSTPEHFTVAILSSSRTQFSVFQTRDSGKTWSGPTTVASDGKTHWNPWLAYSSNPCQRRDGSWDTEHVRCDRGTDSEHGGNRPKSVLGLVWRTNEGAAFPALTPYSIWAATSNDGGLTFSQPLEVNCCSPAAVPGPFTGGNLFQDFSAIALDDQGVFVGWGDWRTGERDIFFSAIKYQSFNHR